MSLQFVLLGWSASGLRCPDHEINLFYPNTTNPYPVSLIQMPNGTGKTTTLTLLRATLSGVAQQWNSEKIRGFQRNQSASKVGKFVVKLAVNNRLLTFELTLDFERGKGSYRTTFPSGIKDKFDPVPKLKKFLNPYFVDLFVFDGELASNLLDGQKTRAREAIESLFQLSLLKDLERVFKDYWEIHAAGASSKTTQGLTRRQNKLKELRRRLSIIQQEQRELHAKQSVLKLEVEKAEEDYNATFHKDRNLGGQLDEIKQHLNDAEKALNFEIEKTIRHMRDPQKLIPGLAPSLLDLKGNLDRLKLPTKTSKEFFEELADAEECICGRRMDEETRQAVRDRANHYLGDDEVSVLNHIKSDIAEACSGDPNRYYEELEEELQNLSNLIRNRDRFKTKLGSIEALRSQQGDQELAEKKKRWEELKAKLEKCTQRLQEIERSPHHKPSDDTHCLKELERLVKQVEADVAEVTNTLQLQQKTNIVCHILAQAHQQAREELRKLILAETNDRIRQLLARDPIFLADIQDSLKLQGQGGASVGQTLSVSYAFLATLFNRSDHQLPFIVDSPALSLDLNVRPEVARLVPKLCDQFVAFTISSERQGFVDILHQAANENVQYLTLFRKTDRMQQLWKNQGGDRTQESEDGVMVSGKDFFDRFDLDEEV